ncbi:CACTA en-spm transposon protein [Cucumis melo var. makuwa]|uniref:CACTA en-spm transposon protein n=1 Tax=Cucumis melo var. makuwa TaxID=1194695 RepID=A0A5D3C8M4_CUCMM|nr:CACTA en-spm transposon protein [Cucumis melo var. makuwa]
MWTNTCHMNAKQITTNDSDEPCTMSSFPSNFDKMDVMFLKFAKDRDNPTEGSLSVGDNSVSTSQPFATPTPRRRSQSRLLELELYVAANGQISITITHGAKKPISPHAKITLRSSKATYSGSLCLISMIKQLIGSLSIRCSAPLKSSGTTVIGTSKETNAGTLVLVYRRGYFVTLWRRDMREDVG